MATNPYSYGSLGQRWTVGEPTSKSLLDVSRVKADANRWALEQLIVDPDDTANFVLTAPGLNIDSNTLYVDSVNNSVGFGLTNPNDYAFNGTPSWVASGGAGNASVIVVSGTTSIGYLVFADGTTGTDRYSGNIQYNHSTNTMSFRTNGGVEAMTINSAQDLAVDGDTLYIDASADRVGINTASPATDMHLLTSGSTAQLRVESGLGNYTQLNANGLSNYSTSMDFDSVSHYIYKVSGSEKMRLTSAGLLGIGTSSPSALIHAEAADGTEGGAIKYTATSEASAYLSASPDGAVLATDTAGIVFRTGITPNDPTDTGTERARIDSSGNVGIGTSSPSALLHLYKSGSTQAGLIETDQSASVFNFKSTGQTAGQPQIGCSGSNLILNTNGSERARILSSGGITFNGDTATANALDDYEEGTWTPAFGSSGATFSYTTQQGQYTKIGNVVNFQLLIVLSAAPTGTTVNPATISLPFSPSGNNVAVSMGESSNIDFEATDLQLVWNVRSASNDIIGQFLVDNGTRSLFIANDLTTGSQIMLSGFFYA